MNTVYRDCVRTEWVDYNGHLRDAFYLLLYSFATDAFMDRIGLDDAGRRARHRTLFTLEAHISYLREMKEGAAVRIDARVIARDSKRVHLYLEMFEGDAAQAVSACEQMLLHIDSSGAPKAASFDDDIAARIADHPAIAAKDARYAGRVIGLPSRPARTASAPADPA
ncbi:thioesterase family protein [Caballeronia sp. LZ062]|uniref:thioesterase family protein n=1 Tax=unclassified Caballeronia TaxID=2646786 RepID=UPI0028632D02|nr:MULTISPECIES: thioesterase family protein [unclassified Caballeronia]MDR5857034.1 thioesterase family protein [Caballeronia sp. LZ050]MDR5869569.1 thioesterase family protein [Caballeronia sp. LZ062]